MFENKILTYSNLHAIKEKKGGERVLSDLSFHLSLENLSYGALLDVKKKRVNAFLKNSLERKEEATEFLCLSNRLVFLAKLTPASSCIWCFSTQKSFKSTLV
jgi:hypothetical protein